MSVFVFVLEFERRERTWEDDNREAAISNADISTHFFHICGKHNHQSWMNTLVLCIEGQTYYHKSIFQKTNCSVATTSLLLANLLPSFSCRCLDKLQLGARPWQRGLAQTGNCVTEISMFRKLICVCFPWSLLPSSDFLLLSDQVDLREQGNRTCMCS